MKLLLLLFAAALVQGQDPCTYDTLTCEWKVARFQWAGCPNGYKPKAHVFWGRDSGDNSTCVSDVPSKYLQNLDCPGNIEAASEAVTQWCDANIRPDGTCKIKAKNVRLGGDPCVNTFKYMRFCRHCELIIEPCSLEGQDATLTCEWKYVKFPWGSCPDGYTRKAHAEWGRAAGDNTTCVDEVPSAYLQDPLYCPGDVQGASEALTEWCRDNPRADGKCKVKATNGKLGGDPCVGTFKYLKACTYCEKDAPPPCDPDDGLLTCEWKYARFPWDACPPGHRRKGYAQWGREEGDNNTCVDEVPYQYLQQLNCPGNDVVASEALTTWCDNNPRSNGQCKIKASNGRLGGDPCVSTFKYLRSCTYCQAYRQGPRTILLLDSTGSMMTMSTSYMPKVVEFLDWFFEYTSNDAFWAGHKTDLHVIPFTTLLENGEEWWLDYGAYTSASQLRSSEKNGMAAFRTMVLEKQPVSLTNIGRTLEMVRMQNMPEDVKMIILVSDFINMQNEPDIMEEVQALANDGYSLHPVLLDKPLRHEDVYDQVLAASNGNLGLDIRGKSESQIFDAIQSFTDA